MFTWAEIYALQRHYTAIAPELTLRDTWWMAVKVLARGVALPETAPLPFLVAGEPTSRD
jgi:hypothetical protein